MLLIDAFNVLHAKWALPKNRRHGLDIPELVARIWTSRHRGRRIRIVVDGRPGPQWPRSALMQTHAGLVWTRIGGEGRGGGGTAEVVFSGKGREADDVIEDVLERSRGMDITMVSSDRRLIRAAKRAGAKQIGNGSFLKELEADRVAMDDPRPELKKNVPLDQYSVAHWMQEFGYTPPAAEAPEPARKPEPEVPAEPAQASSRKKRIQKKKPDAGGVFGEGLSIELPERASAPDPAPSREVARSAEQTPMNPEHEPLDPLLADAFAEWGERLDPAELEMDRWIDGVQPL